MGLNDNTRRIKDALEYSQNIQQQKQDKKIHQNNLRLALEEYFYHYLREHKETVKENILTLYKIENRENIIFYVADNMQEQTKTEYDATYLNNIYEKSLQKISKIFLNNYKYIENELQKEEEQEKKYQKLLQEQAQKEENRKQNIKAFFKMITLSIKFVFGLIFRCIILYYKSFNNFSKYNIKEGENLLFLCVLLFFGLRQSILNDFLLLGNNLYHLLFNLLILPFYVFVQRFIFFMFHSLFLLFFFYISK